MALEGYLFDAGFISFSPEVIKKARKGESPRYLVCGVDVFVSENSAKREGTAIDRTKSFREWTGRPYFAPWGEACYFSSRFYKMIDLLDLDRDMTASTLQEAVTYLPPDVRDIAVLIRNEPTLEEENYFVYTPLTPEEQNELGGLLSAGN